MRVPARQVSQLREADEGEARLIDAVKAGDAAALCLAAGLSTPHYLTLRLAIEMAEQAVVARSSMAKASRADTLAFLQQQYEALREDAPRREALLAAAAAAAAA